MCKLYILIRKLQKGNLIKDLDNNIKVEVEDYISGIL